jgi:hypothetical protein
LTAYSRDVDRESALISARHHRSTNQNHSFYPNEILPFKEAVMNSSFSKIGGSSAILTGVLSIAYAIFYLVIAPRSAYVGTFGSWLILAASGFFTSAVMIALYLRLKAANEGLSLWFLLLGLASSFATLQHGVYEALVTSQMRMSPVDPGSELDMILRLPSQIDPAGLATFFVVGIVTFMISILILQTGSFPRALGYLGLFNALLLVVLYFASAAGVQALILISGGLTSVIVGPIWWMWLGRQLLRGEEGYQSASTAAQARGMAR